MATTACPLAKEDPWVYQTLQPNHIRLILLDNHRTLDGSIKCVLSHFKLGDQPTYSVLSYVSNSLAQEKSILVNGRHLSVDENLNNFLQKLVDLNYTHRWLWIRSMSIDHQNSKESVYHLTRVREIYPLSDAVICFLGEETEEFKFLYTIMRAFNQNELQADLDCPKFVNFIGPRIPEFISALTSITYHHWFTEIWSLQEYVLSKVQLGFIGKTLFDMNYLILFVQRLQSMNVSANAMVAGRFSEIVKFDRLRIITSHEDWMTSSLADQLLHLLYYSSSKKASISHDYIYSLLGITTTIKELPENLKPNYNLPFGQVFANFHNYFLQETNNLIFLQFAGQPLFGEFPSWTPDFRQNMTCSLKHITDYVSISSDKQILTLNGTLLGNITNSFDRINEASHDKRRKLLLRFEQSILHAIAEIHQESNKSVLTKFLQCCVDDNNTGYTESKTMDKFETCQDIIEAGPTNRLARQIINDINQKNWFSTNQGLVLSSTKPIEYATNDVICAFKGDRVESLHVLRLIPNSENYQLIGCMKMELPRYIDTKFFENRFLQKISLV